MNQTAYEAISTYFAERKLVAVWLLRLPPNSPISLDAPDVEANDNITKQKNSDIGRMMTHSSQGKHLTTPFKLRMYLFYKNCVLPRKYS